MRTTIHKTRIIINRYVLILTQFPDSRKKIFFLGLLLTFLVTLKEFITQSYTNYQIYSFGAIDFWSGINPYLNWNHLSVVGKPLDYYLYGPLFSILFTPFAYLPDWIGVFGWNLFSFTLFYISIFALPEKFDFVKKRFIFFYSILILLTSLLSMQFNPLVAAFFLLSFTLLEKGKGFWAVLIILLSGMTKIYGIFQIVMLIFYPRLYKNIILAIFMGVLLILLPLVKIPVNELIAYYQSWIHLLMNHPLPIRFDVIYRPVYAIWGAIERYMNIFSISIFTGFVSISIFKLKIFRSSLLYRMQFLGILMTWAIIFGTSSEKNTYVIAMAGYVIWYLSSYNKRIDKILLWVNFFLIEIMPIDIICPPKISGFLLDKLNLGVTVFAITWFYMVYRTFSFRFNSSRLLS